MIRVVKIIGSSVIAIKIGRVDLVVAGVVLVVVGMVIRIMLCHLIHMNWLQRFIIWWEGLERVRGLSIGEWWFRESSRGRERAKGDGIEFSGSTIAWGVTTWAILGSGHSFWCYLNSLIRVVKGKGKDHPLSAREEEGPPRQTSTLSPSTPSSFNLWLPSFLSPFHILSTPQRSNRLREIFHLQTPNLSTPSPLIFFNQIWNQTFLFDQISRHSLEFLLLLQDLFQLQRLQSFKLLWIAFRQRWKVEREKVVDFRIGERKS